MTRPRLRTLHATLAAAVLASGLGACGNKIAHPHNVDNEGEYADAGPITYQVQLSRELNPASVEDRQYLVGRPAGIADPTRTQEWFAVWVRGLNQTGRPQTTAHPEEFEIVDTQGTSYTPVPLDPKSNMFAWTAERLKPLGVEPATDSPGQYSATQGQELLFKIDVSAYSNRPLTLLIHGGLTGQVLGSVSLDL